MLNHGNHWEYRGEIVSIDSENDTAMIRWKTTRKTNSVDIKDLQKGRLPKRIIFGGVTFVVQ